MKTKGLVLALSFLLVACSPDSDNSEDSGDVGNGDSGNGNGSTSGSLVITAENQDAIITRTVRDFATNDDVKDPFKTFSGTLVTNDTVGSKTLMDRVTETIHCDSGTASVTTEGNDVGTGSEPINGSSSFNATYNDCMISSAAESFSMSMHMNGSMAASMEWTGYEAASNTFDTFALTITMDSFYFSIDQNGETTTMEQDFSMAMELAGNTITQTFSGTTAMEDLGDGYLAVETATPITINYDDSPAYPTSGEVIVSGGDDSSIKYTVVAGGIEVTVNGGQARLYTWSEIENMSGSPVQ